MEREPLPDDVCAFIVENIDTVPHLEALLLIYESAPKVWTAAEMAARVYVQPERARRILEDLDRRRVIGRAAADTDGYRLGPASPELMLAIGRVDAVYRRRIIDIAQLIHSQASPAVREFARAFKIKSER